MADSPKITSDELQSLPRWARLAFAARCVRRARELLSGAPEPLGVIDRALRLVEKASARGHADDQLADAAAGAYTLALNAVEATDRSGDRGGASAMEDALIVTCTVAHGTAFVAEAATRAAAKMASFLAGQAIDCAIQAHIVACPDQVPGLMDHIRNDFEFLQEAVAKEHWGNLSPIPADFFESLSE
jgi:hypothetical protein